MKFSTAQGRSGITTVISAISLAINILLDYLLMKHFQVAGIALAGSLALIPLLLLSLVLFGAIGSLPVSLPIGILGGVIAAMIVKMRPSGWSIARWIALGSACGGILGFVGAGVWFGWEKAIGQQFLPAIPAMATEPSGTSRNSGPSRSAELGSAGREPHRV